MDQHKWVRACQARYKEQGLTPGDPNDGDWDECHYPEPKDFGEEVIYLLHDHHQPQGLWQSEEYSCPCFFSGDAKRFLTHGPFVPGWFDLWGLYDKWSGYHGRVNMANMAKEVRAANGRARVASLTTEMLSKNGTKGSLKTKELVEARGKPFGNWGIEKEDRKALSKKAGIATAKARGVSWNFIDLNSGATHSHYSLRGLLDLLNLGNCRSTIQRNRRKSEEFQFRNYWVYTE